MWDVLHSGFSQSVPDGEFKTSSGGGFLIIVNHELFPSNIVSLTIILLYPNFRNCLFQLWRFLSWLFELIGRFCNTNKVRDYDNIFCRWIGIPP